MLGLMVVFIMVILEMYYSVTTSLLNPTVVDFEFGQF